MTSRPDLFFESTLWPTCRRIAGLDEAGRGALAGPVCVGAVVLPAQKNRDLLRTLDGVRDSKQLTPRGRSLLAPRIRSAAEAWGVGFASAAEIDLLGIVPATRLAAGRALEMLPFFPDYLLTDFRLELPELDLSQTAIVKGDQRCLSIAAASILAKTARDEVMLALDPQFPKYEFARHKGYGSRLHRARIAEHGHSPEHRRSFKLKK